MKPFNKKNFHNLINITYVIAFVMMILMIIATVATSVGFVVVGFLPTHIFDVDPKLFESIDTTIGQSMIHTIITELSASEIKTIIMVMLTLGFVQLSITSFIFTRVIKILNEVKKDLLFSMVIVKNLFIIAYSMLISSIAIPFLSYIILKATLNGVDIPELPFSFDFSYVMMGLLVLILANIFHYGAYLQEEYNQTL